MRAAPAPATLRAEAGRNPDERALSDLVGELSTRSQPFRKWWAAHNVRHHKTGTKRRRHPIVRRAGTQLRVMQLPDEGLGLAVFTAEAGTRSAEALQLLASWSATEAPAERPAEHI